VIELFISARKLRCVTLSDVTGFLRQKSVAGGGVNMVAFVVAGGLGIGAFGR